MENNKYIEHIKKYIDYNINERVLYITPENITILKEQLGLPYGKIGEVLNVDMIVTHATRSTFYIINIKGELLGKAIKEMDYTGDEKWIYKRYEFFSPKEIDSILEYYQKTFYVKQ